MEKVAFENLPFATERLVIRLKFISDFLGTAPSQELLKKDFFKLRETEALMEAEKLRHETAGLSMKAFTEENYKTVVKKTSEEDEGSEEKEEEEIPKLTYFRKDDKGIYIPNFMIKGFLKSSAQALKDQIPLRAFKAKIDRNVFVFPNKIRLYRDGNMLAEPDDVFVRPLRASTPKGERVSLTASERIASEGEIITDEITLVLIKNKDLDMDMIRKFLHYGYFSGIGQFRNGGFGRFVWEEIDYIGDDGVKRKKIKVKQG